MTTRNVPSVAHPHVLYAAFAINADMTSETGIGWSFLRSWVEVLDEYPAGRLTVVTAERFSEKLRLDLNSRNLMAKVEVVPVGLPKMFGWLTSPRLTRFEYLLWCSLARRKIKRLTRSRKATVAHHPIFATEILPSPITRANSDLRVWGPVGSTGQTAVFLRRPINRYSLSQFTTQAVRNAVTRLPAWWTGRRMDLVLAQNSGSQDMFEAIGLKAKLFPNIVLRPDAMTEIALARSTSTRVESHSVDQFRLLAVGHLIPRKRWELAIDALRDPRLAHAKLTVVGRPLEGVEDYLPAMVKDWGLESRVEFAGKLPRAEVLRLMAQSDVLLHPSGREGASGVVGEATAVGLPVVCFAGTGSAAAVHLVPGSGVLLDPSQGGRREFVDAIMRAASMFPTPFDGWTEDRFVSELRGLLASAQFEGQDR